MTAATYPPLTGAEPCLLMDPEEFYAGDNHGDYDRAVIDACRACPIRAACASYAVVHEEHGYWGGLTPQDRHRIRAGRPVRHSKLNGGPDALHRYVERRTG